MYKMGNIVKNQTKSIIKNIIINPCSKGFQNCLCINYLDFTNLDHYNRYKHCIITDENNLKYKKIN
jgi:hypothetical protein